MAFKSKLLATAAIPVIALTWLEPASATSMMRADAPIEALSQVLKVQSDEDELLKQQRKERREQRREQRANQDSAGQDGGEVEQPRRKRQQASDEQQMQQQAEEPVKPRRKKQVEEQVIQDVPQSQDEEPVKPRRKKQQVAEEPQVQEVQQQQDEEPVKPRRKKQQAAEEQQMQKVQPQEEEPVKPRRKQQAQQDDNGSIEEIEPPRRKKQNAEQLEENQPAAKRASEEKPEQVKERKKIAEDPSRTTDTVELPVANGAAVLDSDKDADKRGAGERERRKREREQVEPVRVPKSDREAQAGFKAEGNKPVRIQPVMREKGERITGFKGYDYGEGRRVGRDKDDLRVIINIDGRVVVRDDDRGRLSRNGNIRYERLNNNLIREVVVRPNGDRIITVRNRWGEIVRRSRIDSRHREVVIFYSPLLERGRDRLYLRDPGATLPPMRLMVPVSDYIIDVSGEPDRDYEEFLSQPPVEPVERVYSVDEVKYSARIRDKVRRIDLDTITFETGSAEIDMDQASSLRRVAAAIKDILDRDPGETFLIEGHTDAVGSDESNLVLSDERAESVANVLSDLFDIPAENLVTQGYGERYLKVDTNRPERTNRRVTIRRITSLVRPAESAEALSDDGQQGEDQQYDDQQQMDDQEQYDNQQ